MLIYFITFLLSLIFLKCSTIFKKKNRPISLICVGISILIPCLLAALRDESIGIDVLVYQKPHFLLAYSYSNFFEYMQRINSMEYLYYFITWISAIIFNNLSVLFFLIEFLIIVPLYIALEKIKKNDNDVILGMFVFYFLWYDQTYNMARQSIAIAFSILALVLFEENQKIKSIIILGIAFLFHNSALIMIPMFILLSILKGNSKTIGKLVLSGIVILVTAIIMLKFKTILQLFSSGESNLYGFDKYVNYVNIYNGTNVAWKQLIMWIIYLAISIIYSKNIKSYTQNYYFYILELILFMFGFYVETVVQYSNRIFYYFGYQYIYIIISRLPSSLSIKFNRYAISLLIILLSMSFWISSCVIGNGNHTMPYVFEGEK